ncbi:hypothetical protein [Glycomyces tritici]|uniref:Uncharacterized protein n=1 Tax=Glycomyces tritici TaxID=2665176 RepID=A0ABT7YJE0_9ACTN|nr:hypothetical protein [Glycomyces tritici]MDN3238749.1 hypothetical protein [Glycomyces tritici]
MSRVFDAQFITEMNANITNNVVPILESTNEPLGNLESIDRSLYTVVTLTMAVAYTTAVSTVTEAMAGAGQCFQELHDAVEGCVTDMEEADKSCATAFSGNGN